MEPITIKKPIPTDNITELNDLTQAGGKLVGYEIGITPRNPNRKTKTG